MLEGLMQDRPLLISSLIEHAATFHPDGEIVSKLPEGTIHRTHWKGVSDGAKQVANALARLGVGNGDRVASLAWNSYRHLMLYYGVSGSGAVLNTVNPRLFVEQVEYIINHAGAKVVFFDSTFLPLVEKIAPQLGAVTHFVAMANRDGFPRTDMPGLLFWDELVEQESTAYDWPQFDERSASILCYTSGTTGNPKGVLASHRSLVLMSLAGLAPDVFGVSAFESILLIVPMFHASAWGVPFAAALAGSKLVLPGPHMDGESIYGMMRDEGVTASQGVPTVWMMLFSYLDANPQLNPKDLGVKRIGVGGAQLGRFMLERFERDFGAIVSQGWGMTETNAIGVVNTLLPKHADWDREDLVPVKLMQGRGLWGVDMKIIGPDGSTLPWDGISSGALHVRGPWVASGYFGGEGGDILDEEGFFDTGDVAAISPDGYLRLVDRTKDVIKSGGEWISSIDLENVAAGHPAIAEAAVIAVAHPKWQERPLLVVVRKLGQDVEKQELLDFVAARVAKWWAPDDVVFVDSLPHTATGKIQKNKLREQFGAHQLPTL